MNICLCLISLIVIQTVIVAQNIENKLGASGLFVIEASDGSSIVVITDDGQPAPVFLSTYTPSTIDR